MLLAGEAALAIAAVVASRVAVAAFQAAVAVRLGGVVSVVADVARKILAVYLFPLSAVLLLST